MTWKRKKLKCPNYPSESEIRKEEIGLSNDERKRAATHGGGALVHKTRGRTSNNHLIPGIREYVIELVRSQRRLWPHPTQVK